MIHLHLGVHKTATTYLQTRLAANQGRIFRAGRAYWTLDQLRPRIEQAMKIAKSRETQKLGVFRRPLQRQDPFGELRRFCDLPQDIVLSEENILGHSSSCLYGTGYRDAPWRLGQLAQALKEHEITVMLCIRDYPDFYASIFAEALRHGAYKPLSEFVEDYAAPQGHWPKLLDAVQRAFPGATLIVWKFEDFRRLEPKVLEMLSGLPAADLLPISSNDVRPSASSTAAKQQLAVAAPMSRPLRIQSMAELEDRYPPANKSDRFDPWPQEQRKAMSEAYALDVAALETRPGVTMLRP